MRIQRKKLEELLELGYSYTAIAKIFGVSRQAVYAFAKRQGLTHLHFTPMGELCQQLRVSRETIKRLMQTGGVEATKAGSKWVILSLNIPPFRQCKICSSQIPITRVYCKHHTRTDIRRWRYTNDSDFRKRCLQAQARYKLRKMAIADILKPE